MILATLAALASAVGSGCGAGDRAAAHASVRPPSAAHAPARSRACLSRVPSSQQISRALDVAAARLNADTRTLTPGQFPSVTNRAGNWRLSRGSGWTSGFFPGSLWLMSSRSTGRPALVAAARAWTAALAPQAAVTTSHDIGFEIFTSFGNGYRVTHDDAYRRVILRAAASLATRYDPAVGAVRSWGSRGDNAHFLVIVDGLMNLQLLFWAAQHGGSSDWTQMATRDALTVRKHFIRPDGSLVHLVDFNPVTGAVQAKGNPQGYDLASTWARGQAWAVAGFTIAYAGDTRPAVSRGRAPDRGVLHRASAPQLRALLGLPGPRHPQRPPRLLRGRHRRRRTGVPEPPRPRRGAPERPSAAPPAGCSPPCSTHDLAGRGQALLAHGTSNKPGGSSNTGTSYGDYYFLDALQRYRAALRPSAEPRPLPVMTLTGRLGPRSPQHPWRARQSCAK